jgi:DNA repair protein SbcD/Mre11
MKLVHFADVHLDAPFTWMEPQAARTRRQNLRATLRRIVDLAGEVEADALLCGGDLYEHDRLSPDTERFLVEALASIHPVQVFLAPGNHDWYGPRSLYQRAGWSPNVHVFAADRLEAVELADGVTLWGAAHRAPATTDGFLGGFSVDRGGINLALFHGSERNALFAQGSKAPHAPFDEADIERSGLDHAFVGHYHKPKDAPRHTYPGNPDPLTFGEEGQRGAVIVTVSQTGEIERERWNVATSTVHDLAVDVSGAGTLDEVCGLVCDALVDLAGYARVFLKGELDPDIDLQLSDLDAIPVDSTPSCTAPMASPSATTSLPSPLSRPSAASSCRTSLPPISIPLSSVG